MSKQLSIVHNESEILDLVHKELPRSVLTPSESVGFVLMGYRHWTTNQSDLNLYAIGTVQNHAFQYGIELAKSDNKIYVNGTS